MYNISNIQRTVLNTDRVVEDHMITAVFVQLYFTQCHSCKDHETKGASHPPRSSHYLQNGSGWSRKQSIDLIVVRGTVHSPRKKRLIINTKIYSTAIFLS